MCGSAAATDVRRHTRHQTHHRQPLISRRLLRVRVPSLCVSLMPQNRWRKRGLAVTPTKFGIAFTKLTYNQGGALVHVYTDGTVRSGGSKSCPAVPSTDSVA